MEKETIILGIDPGTTIMGYGIIKVTGNKVEMLVMGILDLKKYSNHYLKLEKIQQPLHKTSKNFFAYLVID